MVRWVAVGVIVGVLALALVRFVAAPSPAHPHYHANWQVVVDGEPLDLSADRYMEDVIACAAGAEVLPVQRVHMHNGEDDVVHVHHEGVAWGHFLQNLGFSAGPDYLILDDGRRLFAEDAKSLTYMVNGFIVDDIRTRLIRPGDRLLINYGPESQPLIAAEYFPRVPDRAAAYDTLQDPAGCAGAVELTFGERLRHAFWH